MDKTTDSVGVRVGNVAMEVQIGFLFLFFCKNWFANVLMLYMLAWDHTLLGP